MDMKVISLYNNKGGVSKTTTLFNLGVFASTVKDKRVLLVDADPQCNLTELFLAADAKYSEPDADLPGTTIYESLKRRFYGDEGRPDVEKVRLVKHSNYKNLSLLRGDFEFALAEIYFSKAVSQAITEEVHEKQTYLALYRLLSDLAKKHNFDYVMIDVGPSTGSITRMSILVCDKILIPVTPDRFCDQAISVLSKVLLEWVNRHREIVKTFGAFGFEIFPGNPEICGLVMQNFKLHGGKAKQSYQKWMNRISQTVKTALGSNSYLNLAEKVLGENPYLALIPNVESMAPLSQMYGRAIFDITREQTEDASNDGRKFTGIVWEDWVARMQSYKDEVGKLYEAIK